MDERSVPRLEDRRSSRHGLRILTLASYVLASGAVYLMWLGFDASLHVRQPGITAWKTARLPDLMTGEAHKPYVLRTLVPTTVKVVAAVIPQRLARRLERRLLRAGRLHLQGLMAELDWEEDWLLEYAVACILTYACLLGSAVLLRDLYISLYPRAEVAGYFLPLIGLLTLPAFFRWGAHVFYDFPTLFLSVLGVLLLHRGHWRLFYPVFALGLLNKETAALLSLTFLAWQWGRMPLKTLAGHLAAQGSLLVLTRVWLLSAFRGSPGPVAEMNLPINLQLAATLHPRTTTTVFFFAAVIFAVMLRWRREGRFARAMLAPLIPLTGAYIVLGKWGEIRFFLEAFAAVVLWSYNGALQLLGLAPPPEERRAAPLE